MPDDKKKYGTIRSKAISKGEQRAAAFAKQCKAYKKRTGAKSCKNMTFNNPVSMSKTEKALYAKSKGNLTQRGGAQADETIRKGFN
jgi:hypothetical protein